jgi:hypothetical protein
VVAIVTLANLPHAVVCVWGDSTLPAPVPRARVNANVDFSLQNLNYYVYSMFALIVVTFVCFHVQLGRW